MSACCRGHEKAPAPPAAEDLGDVLSMNQGMDEQLDECRYEDLAEERELVAA